VQYDWRASLQRSSGWPGRSTAFFRCAECVDPKLTAAVLKICGAAERVLCTSKMDAARADQLRKALSLAAQDPAVGAQPVAGESEGRFCSQSRTVSNRGIG